MRVSSNGRNAIGPDWTLNIFQPEIAEVQRVIFDSIAHELMHGRRNHDMSQASELLQSTLDVDPIADNVRKDTVPLNNNVADVYGDTDR